VEILFIGAGSAGWFWKSLRFELQERLRGLTRRAKITSMRIRVKLIANYQSLLPPGTKGNTIEIDVPDGTTAAEVVASFDVPVDDTSVIVVNGLTVDIHAPLSTGDTVAAFSAIAGG
jgi:sulfur carrier protein ThiS